jgi:hypothetical protein
MSTAITITQIAAALTGGSPLACAQKEDGSLVVIAHTGQKLFFTSDQVEIKKRELEPKRKAAQARQKSPGPAGDQGVLKPKPAASRKKAPSSKTDPSC